MSHTSQTLLEQAQSGKPGAWERIDSLYRPFLLSWFQNQGFKPDDADDLAQDVLLTVSRELKGFDHTGRQGAFRTWLRTIALHRAQGVWRARKLRGQPTGGTDFQQQLESLADSTPDLEELWNREHDAHVLHRLMQMATESFEPNTIAAFRRVAFDDAAPADVAGELKMSVAAVYIAKSRLLRWLREQAAELLMEIDD
jgi:RNA polymerase sigma-70 factor (ECF subfamily)